MNYSPYMNSGFSDLPSFCRDGAGLQSLVCAKQELSLSALVQRQTGFRSASLTLPKMLTRYANEIM